MSFKGWPELKLRKEDGGNVNAKAPLIISASRSTDIPAFYSEWFFRRLEKGYLKWINPFNGKPQFISFQNCRAIVFWTKNPAPILPYIPLLKKRNIHYYFLFSLNNYEPEKLEPNVPPLEKRINTFRNLAQNIGKEKVIWRYDPLLLTRELNIDQLLERIKEIGDIIHPYTEKLIFSFIEIARYKKVQSKLLNESHCLNKNNLFDAEFSREQKIEFAEKLVRLNRRWNLQLSNCAGKINLESYGISRGKCIDDRLMKRLFNEDQRLMHFLNTGECESFNQHSLFKESHITKVSIKDKGQRPTCRCIYSKDIGMYNTCPHLCTYCYANTSAKKVNETISKHDPSSQGLV
jgi:DNA repair photolyase